MTSRLVAAAPPAAFLLAVEVVTRRGKRIGEPVEEPVKLVPELLVESGEPADEPIALAHEPREPVHEPRGPLPGLLTTAARVKAAHVAEPDATNGRIGELAGVSVATVKRHRPSRVNGSPSGRLAAQSLINGETLKVGG